MNKLQDFKEYEVSETLLNSIYCGRHEFRSVGETWYLSNVTSSTYMGRDGIDWTYTKVSDNEVLYSTDSGIYDIPGIAPNPSVDNENIDTLNPESSFERRNL